VSRVDGRAAPAYPDALLRYFKLPELEIYETAWDTVPEKYMPVDLASPLFGYRLLLDTIEIQVVPATQWFSTNSRHCLYYIWRLL
jgi:hypothetical protein